MKRVYLMRGLPGQGKTAVASALAAGHDAVLVVSADHFFTKPDGTYEWFREGLAAAHEWCRSQYEAAIKTDTNVIIVDNTNIKRRDFKFYEDLALEAGYQFFEITVGNLDVEASAKRNKHGVPRETLERMAKEWQR